MSTVYLRAEAVNLGNVIGDTEDLSTIRGSGLMVLDLSKPVEEALKGWRADIEVTLVTSGASQTVFRVGLKENEAPESLVAHVSADLRRHDQLRFATIAVDYAMGEYDEAREYLLAKNRRRQLREASVSIAGAFPSSYDSPEEGQSRRAPWCEVDTVRPAAKWDEHVRNEDKRLVSESVFARRRFGRDAKQAFYRREIGWSPRVDIVERLKAAWHFHQIAEFDRDSEGHPTKDYRELPSNLDGKIAVFYVDGNSFGGIQAKQCTSEDRQRQWDDIVQGQKKAALRQVLNQASDEAVQNFAGPGWWRQPNDQEWQLRFETLLWGGDELLWVVPAWQGWNVAATFFRTVRAMQPKPKPAPHAARAPAPPGKKKIIDLDAKPSKKEQEKRERELAKAREDAAMQPLEISVSYSAGLVFCHAEAPIHRVWQLAKDLADEAKESGKNTFEMAIGSAESSEDRKNLLSYAALESFDQLGRSIKAARREHLPFPPSDDETVVNRRLRQTVLHADDLQTLHDEIPWIRDNFPHGAVHKLLRVLRREADAGKQDSEFAKWFQRATAELAPGRVNDCLGHFGAKAVESNRELSPEERVNWLHLAELWDYIV